MSPPDEVPPLDPTVRPAVVGLGPLRRLARRVEFDRAVFYALAARVWQTLAGPVTVVLIATRFTPELQGDYYAFGALLIVQSLFELSLSVVILNAAGHEWVLLRLGTDGRVEGDAEAAARLAGLDRFGTRWYGVVALLCLAGLGAAGHLMFRGLDWSGHAAWAATVTAAAAMLALLPRMAILRGCHQVVAVNRNMAVQAVCGTLAVWAAVLAGLGLWAVAASWLMRLAWEAWLVFWQYGAFFRSLRQRQARQVGWASEIWPLQWRLAVQTVAAAAATSSFVLALYQLPSKREAGEMGMTLSVLNMLLWGGLAWVQTRIPVLLGHSRRNERAEYDRLFRRVVISTFVVVATGAAAFFAAVAAMRAVELEIAERFVGTTTFALLTAAVVAQHVLNCLTIYSRTRRREPFLVPTVVLNVAIAAGVWLAAPVFGELGVAVVYAGVVIVVGLPVWGIVWGWEKQEWEK